MPRSFFAMFVVLPLIAGLASALPAGARDGVVLDQAALRSTLQQTFDRDLAAVLAEPAQVQPARAAKKPTKPRAVVKN